MVLELNEEDQRILFGEPFNQINTNESDTKPLKMCESKCAGLKRASKKLLVKLLYKNFIRNISLEKLNKILKSRKHFSEIWNFALNKKETSNDEVIASRITFNRVLGFLKGFSKSLSKLLTNFRNRISELELDVYRSGPFDIGTFHELDRYLHIASYVTLSDEVKKFVEELININDYKRMIFFRNGERKEYNYGPFVFICDSSGSGKTQMALSTSLPYLYFVLKTDTDAEQKIYGAFNTQSTFLQNLLSEDYKEFKKEMRSKNPFDVSVETVGKSKLKYRSVGFLVSMIKEIVNGHIASNIPIFSAKIQAEISQLESRPMSLQEARDALLTLLPLYKGINLPEYFVFPIFFDECAMGGENLVENEFLFLRGIVRCILCTPIFMGTNAKPSNFLGSSLVKTGKASRADDERTWCLFWRGLPKLSDDIFTENVAKIRTKLTQWRASSEDHVFSSEEAINIIFRWVRDERPLFFFYVIRVLEAIVSHHIITFKSDMQFFEYCIEKMLHFYRDHKISNGLIPFNTGQLAYMTSFYWNTDLLVHSHLASPHTMPWDVNFPVYSKLTAVVQPNKHNKNVYIRKYLFKTDAQVNSQESNIFDLNSIYEPFSEKVLTGFLVTGVNSTDMSVLRGQYGNNCFCRVSVMNVIREYTVGRTENVPGYAAPSNSGSILEFGLMCAAIFASRKGKLGGTDFFAFLNQLCFELDIYGESHTNAFPQLLGNVDERLKKALSGFKIPFLSPMGSEPWSQTVVEDLTFINGGEVPFLGIAYPSVKIGARADFAVSAWNENDQILPKNVLPPNPLLIGQCKLYQIKIGANEFNKDIFKGFDIYSGCRVFLVVAPEYTKLLGLKHKDYKMWKVIKDIQHGGLSLVPLNSKQYTVETGPNNMETREKEEEAYKHIILLSLKELFSGKNFDFEGMKKFFMKQR